MIHYFFEDGTRVYKSASPVYRIHYHPPLISPHLLSLDQPPPSLRTINLDYFAKLVEGPEPGKQSLYIFSLHLAGQKTTMIKLFDWEINVEELIRMIMAAEMNTPGFAAFGRLP